MYIILDIQKVNAYLYTIEFTASDSKIDRAPFAEIKHILSAWGLLFLLTFCQKVVLDVSFALAKIHIYTNWFCSFKHKSLHFFCKKHLKNFQRFQCQKNIISVGDRVKIFLMTVTVPEQSGVIEKGTF